MLLEELLPVVLLALRLAIATAYSMPLVFVAALVLI